MSRRRFFVQTVHRGEAELTGEEAKHLTRVLRVEVGQRYEISDNQRVWLAEVVTARKEHVVFRIGEAVAPRPLPVRTRLFAALIKFDHFEWMIEKATELGVHDIVPVIAIRSEHGLERAAPKRIERWRRILIEASQQSRRDQLPEIVEPVDLEEAIAAEDAGFRIALDEAAGAPPLLSVLPAARHPGDVVSLLVGPEGGWTEEERASFAPAGWIAASLGPLVLRAETAASAALAVVQNAWMEQRGE